MTFTDAIESCFRNYARFSGRATRSEYWWWFLFMLLITWAGQVVSEVLGTLVVLATLLPYIAVTARRLHDIGRSGWWQLIGLVPLIGWAVMLYWCVKASDGDNAYGEAPSDA